jgi:hypothetical protein
MKCTQYGLYEQAAIKNSRASLFFEIGAEWGAIYSWDFFFFKFFVELARGVGSRALDPIHLLLKFCGGCLISANNNYLSTIDHKKSLSRNQA